MVGNLQPFLAFRTWNLHETPNETILSLLELVLVDLTPSGSMLFAPMLLDRMSFDRILFAPMLFDRMLLDRMILDRMLFALMLPEWMQFDPMLRRTYLSFGTHHLQPPPRCPPLAR